jgi:hypothetical protein
MVIAIVVVFIVAVAVARGRGDRMSVERGDYAPLDLGPVSATDVVLLRPPTNLWGYNMQATDEAMDQIAESIRERDVRIVALEQLVTDLSREHAAALPLASPYAGARHRREADEAVDTSAIYQAQPGYTPVPADTVQGGTVQGGTVQAGPRLTDASTADTMPDLAGAAPGGPSPAEPDAAAGPAGPELPEQSHD